MAVKLALFRGRLERLEKVHVATVRTDFLFALSDVFRLTVRFGVLRRVLKVLVAYALWPLEVVVAAAFYW